MKSLYFILLLGSVFVPFVLSFDKKLKFYKQWKFLFPSIFIVASFYILFDVILTAKGVWGFNANYTSSISIVGLPLEECLFFIIIPYASIFLHDCIVLYFPKLRLSNLVTNSLSVILILIAIVTIYLYPEKTYTVYISITVILVLLLSFMDNTHSMNSYYISYLVILIPFIIVNGILTGTGIEEPVVWYNNNEILGLRILTIPIEDAFYGFSLMAFVLLLRIKLKTLFTKKI